MRFAYLGSGSKGNALIVEAGDTRVLLDCGLPLVEVDARLARLGLMASDLTAIIVTHEHGDHIGGVAKLARRNKLPVWLTAGTRAAWKAAPDEWVRTLSPHRAITLGNFEITPYQCHTMPASPASTCSAIGAAVSVCSPMPAASRPTCANR